jgi:hypothetical protein
MDLSARLLPSAIVSRFTGAGPALFDPLDEKRNAPRWGSGRDDGALQ